MKAIKMGTEKCEKTNAKLHMFLLCVLLRMTQKTTSKLKIGHFRCPEKERIIGGFEKLLFSSDRSLFFSFVLWELGKGSLKTWQSNASLYLEKKYVLDSIYYHFLKELAYGIKR